MLTYFHVTFSHRQGVKVHIFSSGSVQAQKLLFGFSDHGDLNEYFDKNFDISTSGNKKQAASYSNIAKDLGVNPSEIVFCSDDEAELKAAKEAGIGNPIMSIRPGNAPISSTRKLDSPRIFSLMQLCGL
jgi:2,3-diketo-5-methylthio-1-phosphopentane phosphatase